MLPTQMELLENRDCRPLVHVKIHSLLLPLTEASLFQVLRTCISVYFWS